MYAQTICTKVFFKFHTFTVISGTSTVHCYIDLYVISLNLILHVYVLILNMCEGSGKTMTCIIILNSVIYIDNYREC